eukprot:scaffold1930_cov346-Prasinococcus_capsulatus_cf.AAC.19
MAACGSTPRSPRPRRTGRAPSRCCSGTPPAAAAWSASPPAPPPAASPPPEAPAVPGASTKNAQHMRIHFISLATRSPTFRLLCDTGAAPLPAERHHRARQAPHVDTIVVKEAAILRSYHRLPQHIADVLQRYALACHSLFDMCEFVGLGTRIQPRYLH